MRVSERTGAGRLWLALGAAFGAWTAVAPIAAAVVTKPNVLFIAADDLNHWVGHLGRHPQARTPNIDRLARMGVTFTRANCPAPACNPSRTALLSGLRPGTTGVYDNGQAWSPSIKRDQVITTQFIKAGYRVVGAGKIFHGSARRPGEWTEYFEPKGKARLQLDPSAKPDGGVDVLRFGPLANRDDEMPDYRAVSYAIEQLSVADERPWFLAVGFEKPHMPFSVPKAWFDLFPLNTIELPPHRSDDLSDVPRAGRRLTKYEGDHAEMMKSGRWKEAVQAYLATIAFMDSQLGRLIDALEASPDRENTVICFWGDHGWHLGEKSRWRKFTLWEESARTVLIWKVPGVTRPGGVCERPVDLMSIYPTLCALAGIPTPRHVEGLDIRPLLAEPASHWPHDALTTYHRNNHSIRSQDWRYISYADGSEELYHHPSDPYEWTNLADDPAHREIKRHLARSLPSVNVPAVPRLRGGD